MTEMFPAFDAVEPLLEQFNICTFEDDHSMWIYQPQLGYYKRAENLIHQQLSLIPELASIHKYNDVLHNLRGRTYCPRFIPPNFICLKNGVFNLSTGKLEAHSPTYHFLNRLEIDYNPKARCPNFLKLISNLPHPEIIQKWFSYHLIPRQPWKQAMFLLGKHNTGKSTLLNVLTYFLGETNVTHHQLREFDNDNGYALADLYGKVANIHPDLGIRRLQDVSTFKTLVGNDTISGRHIRDSPFSFMNNAKLTFACNRMPTLYDEVIKDDAFWERVIIIEFRETIPKESRIQSLHSLVQQELSGVLNWTLEGYISSSKGTHRINTDIKETKKTWVASSLQTDWLIEVIREISEEKQEQEKKLRRTVNWEEILDDIREYKNQKQIDDYESLIEEKEEMKTPQSTTS